MARSFDDLFVLQRELAAHITAALATAAPGVHVLTPAELGAPESERAAQTHAQPTPAVNVVYLGHKFPPNMRVDGKGVVIKQLLVAEVVTRNVRNLTSGADARHDSGALCALVLKACMGERLPSAASLLQARSGPGPSYADGMQFVPLPFEVDLVLTKAPTV